MSNLYYQIENDYKFKDFSGTKERGSNLVLNLGAYMQGKGKPGIQITIQNSGFHNGTAFYTFNSKEEVEDFIKAIQARLSGDISATDEGKWLSKFNKL